MGIESFNIAPDNKGGRPKKEEQETVGKSRSYGDAYTPYKADEDWWREKINESVDGSEINTDDFDQFVQDMMQLADHVHTSTIEVEKLLDEAGVVDIDWSWVREEAPDEWKDMRWPREARHKTFSPDIDTSTEEEDEEPAGGLASIVNEAKKS